MLKARAIISSALLALTLVLPLGVNAVTVGTVTTGFTTVDATSKTVTHTVAAGTDVLVVGVSTTNPAVVTCTYAAVGMTNGVSLVGTGNVSAYVFYLATPTTGSNDVVCTSDLNAGVWIVGAINLDNVDTAAIPDGTATNEQTSTTDRAVTVTTTKANTLVIGVLDYASGGETITGNDTVLWDVTANDGATTAVGGGQTIQQASPGAAVVNWTVSSGTIRGVSAGMGFSNLVVASTNNGVVELSTPFFGIF